MRLNPREARFLVECYVMAKWLFESVAETPAIANSEVSNNCWDILFLFFVALQNSHKEAGAKDV